MSEGKPREVKVVLLGDTGVGKSSLVLRFVTNNFKPYSESTIGASFMSKMIMVDAKPIKFQIWDTAGQEKYHSLAPMYYRGAAAAVIVYDITRSVSRSPSLTYSLTYLLTHIYHVLTRDFLLPRRIPLRHSRTG